MALHFEGWAVQHLLSMELFTVQIKKPPRGKLT